MACIQRRPVMHFQTPQKLSCFSQMLVYLLIPVLITCTLTISRCLESVKIKQQAVFPVLNVSRVSINFALFVITIYCSPHCLDPHSFTNCIQIQPSASSCSSPPASLWSSLSLSPLSVDGWCDHLDTSPLFSSVVGNR